MSQKSTQVTTSKLIQDVPKNKVSRLLHAMATASLVNTVLVVSLQVLSRLLNLTTTLSSVSEQPQLTHGTMNTTTSLLMVLLFPITSTGLMPTEGPTSVKKDGGMKSRLSPSVSPTTPLILPSNSGHPLINLLMMKLGVSAMSLSPLPTIKLTNTVATSLFRPPLLPLPLSIAH
jgi:hypothetical protein